MKTAALVLAILGSVFGALGAIIAVLFGSAIETASFGLGGTGIARNATWAFAAIVLGIVGAVLVGRRPRIAAVMLIAAAVVGVLGTAAFALGTLLYVIAAGLALFVKTVSASTGQSSTVAAASTTPLAPAVAEAAAATSSVADSADAPRSTAPSGFGARYLGPTLSRRSTQIAAASALLIVAIVVGTAIVTQAAEQRPATALFDALQAGDDAGLAALLPSSARSGDPARDAQSALRSALGSSSLAFLTVDWLRGFGPATGTKMAFENLTTTTLSKTADASVIRVTGVFSPSNPNPLINLALQVARVGFSADIHTIRDGSAWYLGLDTQTNAPPTHGDQPQPGPSSPPPTRSTPPPTPTPSPSSTPLPTATIELATFTADFNTVANLPAPGRIHFGRYALTYQGGHALLSGCVQGSVGDRCFWGINRPAGFVSVAATAASQSEWGVMLRALRDDWFDTQALNSAALASINPRTGQFQIVIVSHAGAVSVDSSGGQVVASGPCVCINRSAANTIEFGVRGAELVLKVNGVPAAKVADTQTLRGSGYGVFWLGGPPDGLTSIDLTYFAAK